MGNLEGDLVGILVGGVVEGEGALVGISEGIGVAGFFEGDWLGTIS